VSLSVTERQEGNKTVLAIQGRLDGQNSEVFTQDVTRLIGEGRGSYVLDFSQVPYISSAGLRGILILAKEVRRSGGHLSICSPVPMVLEVMNLARLSMVVPIHATLEEALAS